MSRYEKLRNDQRRLRAQQIPAVMVPAMGGALLVAWYGDGSASLLTGLAALLLLPLVLHWSWFCILPAYRSRADRLATIGAEIAGLKRCMAAVFDKYRTRRKGERFKQVYDLAGRSVHDLEEALAIGMFRERREVFVTAFMRDGMAVRVTASIGTPFRCRAADNPARWKDHATRLRCDEIRQYHNHPDHGGSTVPSKTDIRSAGAIRKLLGPHGGKLRSLLICWNELREWKVFEYDEAGRHSLHFEYDAGHAQ